MYAVTPLLEDALTDRDLVHRQTASTVVKHMALGVFGLGREDAMTHLLNFVWPNIFETSPHVINAVMEAIDGMRVCLGANRVLQYTLQGLFHPARRVREVYWKIYNNLYIGAQDALTPACTFLFFFCLFAEWNSTNLCFLLCFLGGCPRSARGGRRAQPVPALRARLCFVERCFSGALLFFLPFFSCCAVKI